MIKPFPLFPLVAICILFLAGCNNAASGETSVLLQERIAEQPLEIAERYLQQNQPGSLPRVFQTSQLLDRHGVLLAELIGEGHRLWLSLDQIDRDLVNATVATEDASFFTNNGVDAGRVLAALWQNFRSKEVVSGASTITMQLARNLFFPPEQRFDQRMERKVQEATLARNLTQLYSKDELLEIYLNLLNYGNLAYGPAAAAESYFGKSVSDLTLAEAALLAGIPQQPARLNPFEDFEAARQRQRVVLDLMVRHQYLSVAEADAAFAEPLTLRPDRGRLINRAPHFTQYIVDQLQKEIGAEADLTDLLRAGLRITTTLDLGMQTLAQSAVQENVAKSIDTYNMTNAALVAMKPHSGEIVVMVGSVSFADASIAGQVNVAVRLRQPGSAIKPLFYATAFEDNLINPTTVLWDIPVTYTVESYVDGGPQIYIPGNYDGKFHGPVTVRTALANSYNVPAVKLVDAIGVERMLSGARAMGVISLDRPTNWYGLSLTLGGGEVTLLDLTAGFHTLASEGTYYPPKAILAIDNSWGTSIAISQTMPTQALSPETAFLISDILSDNTARTPAFGSTSPLNLSRPAAAKTGTTTDYRDNWTMGYTRYLVAGVWAGNSDGKSMRNTSGVTGAAPIWHDFMQGVLNDPALLATLNAPPDAAAWQFTQPVGIEVRPDCPPGVICRAGGEYTNRRWLEKMGEAGPLADSVETVRAAPVYVQQGETTRPAGFCSTPTAIERTLLKANPRLIVPKAPITTTVADDSLGADDTAEEEVEEDEITADSLITDTPAIELGMVVEPTPVADLVFGGEGSPTVDASDIGHMIAWALRYSAPINLGPCEQLNALAPQALALAPQEGDVALRVWVDLPNAASPLLGEVPSPGAVDIAALTGLPDPATSAVMIQPAPNAAPVPMAFFAVGGVVHDSACAGQYVIGQVQNQYGAPLPGVRVLLRDQWGNQSETVSKGSATDNGLFDFPIYAYSPHELYLTVVDGSGTALSPTITIEHLQGEAGQWLCHHVVMRGG